MATALAAKPKRTTKIKKAAVKQTALQNLNGSYTQLRELMGNDDEVTLFFIEWVSNGRNAQKAYKAIKPDVTIQSAAVMGHRMLSRVNLALVLDSYGLGVDTYFKKLKEGLSATRLFGKNAVKFADYKTRRAYHETLGVLHGIEKPKDAGTTFNFNTIGTVIQNARKERGLEG